MAAMSIQELIASFDKKEEESRLANLSRENQVRAIYDQVISRYQSGGAFEQAGEAMIGRAKTKDVGARTQHAIGSGLFNTQATGAIGQSWEQDVGAGMRTGLQDTMMQRLSSAQLGKADFITGIENRYPDSGQLGGMMEGMGQASGGGGSADTDSLWNRDVFGITGNGDRPTPGGLKISNKDRAANRAKASEAAAAARRGTTPQASAGSPEMSYDQALKAAGTGIRTPNVVAALNMGKGYKGRKDTGAAAVAYDKKQNQIAKNPQSRYYSPKGKAAASSGQRSSIAKATSRYIAPKIDYSTPSSGRRAGGTTPYGNPW